jgi:hypothetical protein
MHEAQGSLPSTGKTKKKKTKENPKNRKPYSNLQKKRKIAN